MTAACGIVVKLDEKVNNLSDKASFSFNDLKARGDIFEEFYYDTESLNVLKYQPVNKTYTVGDKIPTTGESYKYPDSFDIIVLRDKVSIKIRDKKITEIIPISDYKYDNLPVINGRGFEIKATSDDEIQNFLKEYFETEGSDQKELFSKWIRFDTYRKVIFSVNI
jgi:sulfate adenylyltransferase subunit 1